MTSDISEVSWFSCRTCLDGPGVFDEAGSAEDSRWRPPPCGLPPQSSGVGTPMAAFRPAMARPADAPVHASLGPSAPTAGPGVRRAREAFPVGRLPYRLPAG